MIVGSSVFGTFRYAPEVLKVLQKNKQRTKPIVLTDKKQM